MAIEKNNEIITEEDKVEEVQEQPEGLPPEVIVEGEEEIEERHRHRYEVNPDLIESIEEAGMKFVGKDDSI